MYGLLILTTGCSASRNINASWKKWIRNDTALQQAHTGIAMYDPAQKKYLFQKSSNKYFTPASNTKIATLYAAMRYLEDRVPSFKYGIHNDTLFVLPLGDPSFLYPKFSNQPAKEFLDKQPLPVAVIDQGWETTNWGSGWSWNDYQEAYMAERSLFPVYGNCIRWKKDSLAEITSTPTHPFPVILIPGDSFSVKRAQDQNHFFIQTGNEKAASATIPFKTNGIQSALELLGPRYSKASSARETDQFFYAGSTDSLYRIMMTESDNFIAEQLLLMVSRKKIGVFNESLLIGQLLEEDFKDFPQKPRWADGSGLSRYNLFTPEDMIWLLSRLEKEFGIERLKNIFPPGNSGTLRGYYTNESEHIFAKTGTLSGVVALSGYLYTKKNRLLLFSVLVNHHQRTASEIRRTVESFIRAVHRKN